MDNVTFVDRRQGIAAPHILSGLQSIAFEHPSDRAILSKLKAIPVVNTAVGKLVDVNKRQIEIGLIANAIHATQDSMPILYDRYRTACRVLCLSEPYPPLYVEQNPLINAYTIGCDEPYVCITSGSVVNLTQEEIMYIMGHELGHVLAGHVRYGTLVRILVSVGQASGLLGGLLDVTAMPWLFLWQRRSELTADRAGLLACQNSEAAYRASMKLAGYPPVYYEHMTTAPFLKQAEEFTQCVSGSLMDNMFDLANHLYASHPRLVERAAELKNWINDSSYEELVDADEGERKQIAARVEKDPFLAELHHMISQSLTAWSEKEFQISHRDAAKPIRRMLNGIADLRNTPVSPLLRVELVVEKEGVNTVRYFLVLLVNRSGHPVRIKLAVLYADSWDQSPAEIRHEFIKTGQKQIVSLIYSVGD